MPAGRAAVVAGLATVALLADAPVATADAAEPTDYRSVVVSITPPTDVVDIEFLGGGTFVQLTVEPGARVVVRGYQNEPFLRFLPDGTVQANDRSPTLYLSADARGDSSVPAHADAALPPDWVDVGSDGRYAWHDHRAHWMSPEPPPGSGPGDRITVGTIPLRVDGRPVEVAVAVDLRPGPSAAPLLAGGAIALAVLGATLLRRRRLVVPLLLAAGAAAVLGWWQFRSFPAEADPRVLWWLLPVVAAASAAASLVLGHRLTSYALAVLAGLELAVWAFLRRDGAVRPVLPTDAPPWLDRGVLGATAVVAVVATAGSLLRLYRGPPPQ